MQEWMIAMLVNQHYADHTGHGKNYFSRKSAGYRRTAVLCRRAIPQKERVEKYAASFQ